MDMEGDRQPIIHDAPPAPPVAGQVNYGAMDPPPAYEEHQPPRAPDSRGGNPLDAPPSYDSLYGQLRAAQAQSSSKLDLFVRIVKIILGTIFCTVLVGFILAIPISMIAMGSVFLHDCPREPYIPIYLIVGGCFGVVKNLYNFGQRVKNRTQEQDEDNAKTNVCDVVLNFFLLAWFIAGSVWIYRIRDDYDAKLDPSRPAHYCYGPLYLYAFWMTTVTYILAAFCTCCCLCASCLAVCLGAGPATE